MNIQIENKLKEVRLKSLKIGQFFVFPIYIEHKFNKLFIVGNPDGTFGVEVIEISAENQRKHHMSCYDGNTPVYLVEIDEVKGHII